MRNFLKDKLEWEEGIINNRIVGAGHAPYCHSTPLSDDEGGVLFYTGYRCRFGLVGKKC